MGILTHFWHPGESRRSTAPRSAMTPDDIACGWTDTVLQWTTPGYFLSDIRGTANNLSAQAGAQSTVTEQQNFDRAHAAPLVEKYMRFMQKAHRSGPGVMDEYIEGLALIGGAVSRQPMASDSFAKGLVLVHDMAATVIGDETAAKVRNVREQLVAQNSPQSPLVRALDTHTRFNDRATGPALVAGTNGIAPL